MWVKQNLQYDASAVLLSLEPLILRRGQALLPRRPPPNIHHINGYQRILLHAASRTLGRLAALRKYGCARTASQQCRTNTNVFANTPQYNPPGSQACWHEVNLVSASIKPAAGLQG